MDNGVADKGIMDNTLNGNDFPFLGGLQIENIIHYPFRYFPLLPAIIRRFLCDRNIMRMAFFDPCIRDLYKHRIL